MPRPKELASVNVLGVELSAFTVTGAIDLILKKSEDRSSSYWIVRPNAEHLVRAVKDDSYRKLLSQSHYALPDGISCIWLSYYLNCSNMFGFRGLVKSIFHTISNKSQSTRLLPQRIGGLDLTLPLLRQINKRDKKLYIVGHPRRIQLEESVKYIRHNFKNINIVGYYDSVDAKTLQSGGRFQYLKRRIQQADPDIILICSGSPYQEVIANKLTRHLKHGVIISEGGSLDFQQLGGKFRRSPMVIQRFGAEWLWRLAVNPARLSRTIACVGLIPIAYSNKNRGRALGRLTVLTNLEINAKNLKPSISNFTSVD